MSKKLLQELRKECGLTQRALAKQVGLRPSTIAMYELGERTPPLDTAKRIAGYFNTKVEDIFFGEDARIMRATLTGTNN